jgi:hypothetical protein
MGPLPGTPVQPSVTVAAWFAAAGAEAADAAADADAPATVVTVTAAIRSSREARMLRMMRPFIAIVSRRYPYPTPGSRISGRICCAGVATRFGIGRGRTLPLTVRPIFEHAARYLGQEDLPHGAQAPPSDAHPVSPFRGPLQVASGSVLDSLFPPSSAARSRRGGYPNLGGTGKPPRPGRTGRCLMRGPAACGSGSVLDVGRIAEAAGRGSGGARAVRDGSAGPDWWSVQTPWRQPTCRPGRRPAA